MKDLSRLEPIDYLGIIWRRRRFFVAVMILVIAGSAGYAWYRPIIYRSETRIIIESGSILDDTFGAAGVRDRTEERAAAIRQLVESRTVLQRIVEEFRLRSLDTTMPMEDALAAIRRNLEVSKPSGNAFTIAYYATEPQQAQAILRRLAEILIQTNQAAQRNLAVGKDQFLEQELRDAQQQLAALEEKIRQFKADHLGELPEQAQANMNALNGLYSQLAALDSSLERARDQQKALEFRLGEQKRLAALARSLAAQKPAAAPGAPEKPSPSALETQLQAKRAMLADIIARYTDKHPDVQRITQEIRDLEQRLASAPGETLTPLGQKDLPQPVEGAAGSQPAEAAAEAEIAQVQFELDALARNIARREKDREGLLKNIEIYQKRLNMAPALEQELLSLMRDFDAKQRQVDNLQAKKFNAQMAANAVADKKFETYRILDEASLPEKPVPPTRLQIVLIGLAASLGAGVAAALVREYFEPSLADEDEAAAVLKIPVLVSVPEIPKK
jgi:polysaccharide chain length determinant protein (PEP-CTERM system associated)